MGYLYFKFRGFYLSLDLSASAFLSIKTKYFSSDIFALKFTQNCTTITVMNGTEFIKKVKILGKINRISVRFETKRGKGSHGTLYYGSHFTIVKDRKKEIGPGLLNKMLADLNLTKGHLK